LSSSAWRWCSVRAEGLLGKKVEAENEKA